MKIIKPVAASLLSLSLVLAGCGNTQTSILESIAKDIHCPGNYGGHQQGMANDRQTAFFWSHTTQLAKTDLHGNLLNVIDVPSHHGDLDYYQGKVYVAANPAGFNGQAPADSWVYVYDAQDLSLIARHSVPELVFGAGGIAIHDGRVEIVQEGKHVKFLPDVEHRTFSGDYARKKGRPVLYVTERAVFRLRESGMTLVETAPGISLEKDILSRMQFKPDVADDLKEMDARLFREPPVGISLHAPSSSPLDPESSRRSDP